MPEIEEQEIRRWVKPIKPWKPGFPSADEWAAYHGRTLDVLALALSMVLKESSCTIDEVITVGFGTDFNVSVDLALGTEQAGHTPSTERIFIGARSSHGKPYFMFTRRDSVPSWDGQCRDSRFYYRCQTRQDATELKSRLANLDWATVAEKISYYWDKQGSPYYTIGD